MQTVKKNFSPKKWANRLRYSPWSATMATAWACAVGPVRIEAESAILVTTEAADLDHLKRLGLLHLHARDNSQLSLTVKSPDNSAAQTMFVRDDWTNLSGEIDQVLGSLNMRNVRLLEDSASEPFLAIEDLSIARIGSNMFHATATMKDGHRYEWTHPTVCGLIGHLAGFGA